MILKTLFNFDICRFSKRASLSEINPILPSKTGGFLRAIGSAFNRMRQGGVNSNCSERLWLHARAFLVTLENRLGWPGELSWRRAFPLFPLNYASVVAAKTQITTGVEAHGCMWRCSVCGALVREDCKFGEDLEYVPWNPSRACSPTVNWSGPGSNDTPVASDRWFSISETSPAGLLLKTSNQS